MHYNVLADGDLAVVVADVDFASEWARLSAADRLPDPPSRLLEMADAGTARVLLQRNAPEKHESRMTSMCRHGNARRASCTSGM